VVPLSLDEMDLKYVWLFLWHLSICGGYVCHAPRPGPVEWQPSRAYRPKSLYTRKAKYASIKQHSGSQTAHLFILQALLHLQEVYVL
jgi:hypothetical protein